MLHSRKHPARNILARFSVLALHLCTGHINLLGPIGDRYSMKSLREYAVLPISALFIFTVSFLTSVVSPNISTAQSVTPSPAEGDRASIAQPAVPSETDPAAHEAALKQAEDDLLQKLSASLPSSSEAASAEPATAIIVAEAPKTQTAVSTPGAVLTERISSTQLTTASSGTQLPPAIAPLTTCAPCAVQPASTKPAQVKRPSRPSTSSSRASISNNTARDEFTFHGRSGNCSDSIDNPYVPTSQQARVVASRAHLRIGPGRDESTLFLMPKSAIVSVESRNGQWYRVVTATGIRGWLSTNDVIFDVDVPESSTVRVGPYNGTYEPTGIKF